MVAVISRLRGQIKSDTESRLPLFPKIAVTHVALPGAAETRVLAHRPETPAVHCGLHAARERKLSRIAKLFIVIQIGNIKRRIETLDWFSGDAGKNILAFLFLTQRPIQDFFLPFVFGGFDFSKRVFVKHYSYPPVSCF